MGCCAGKAAAGKTPNEKTCAEKLCCLGGKKDESEIESVKKPEDEKQLLSAETTESEEIHPLDRRYLNRALLNKNYTSETNPSGYRGLPTLYDWQAVLDDFEKGFVTEVHRNYPNLSGFFDDASLDWHFKQFEEIRGTEKPGCFDAYEVHTYLRKLFGENAGCASSDPATQVELCSKLCVFDGFSCGGPPRMGLFDLLWMAKDMLNDPRPDKLENYVELRGKAHAVILKEMGKLPQEMVDYFSIPVVLHAYKTCFRDNAEQIPGAEKIGGEDLRSSLNRFELEHRQIESIVDSSSAGTYNLDAFLTLVVELQGEVSNYRALALVDILKERTFGDERRILLMEFIPPKLRAVYDDPVFGSLYDSWIEKTGGSLFTSDTDILFNFLNDIDFALEEEFDEVVTLEDCERYVKRREALKPGIVVHTTQVAPTPAPEMPIGGISGHDMEEEEDSQSHEVAERTQFGSSEAPKKKHSKERDAKPKQKPALQSGETASTASISYSEYLQSRKSMERGNPDDPHEIVIDPYKIENQQRVVSDNAVSADPDGADMLILSRSEPRKPLDPRGTTEDFGDLGEPSGRNSVDLKDVALEPIVESGPEDEAPASKHAANHGESLEDAMSRSQEIRIHLDNEETGFTPAEKKDREGEGTTKGKTSEESDDDEEESDTEDDISIPNEGTHYQSAQSSNSASSSCYTMINAENPILPVGHGVASNRKASGLSSKKKNGRMSSGSSQASSSSSSSQFPADSSFLGNEHGNLFSGSGNQLYTVGNQSSALSPITRSDVLKSQILKSEIFSPIDNSNTNRVVRSTGVTNSLAVKGDTSKVDNVPHHGVASNPLNINNDPLALSTTSSVAANEFFRCNLRRSANTYYERAANKSNDSASKGSYYGDVLVGSRGSLGGSRSSHRASDALGSSHKVSDALTSSHKASDALGSGHRGSSDTLGSSFDREGLHQSNLPLSSPDESTFDWGSSVSSNCQGNEMRGHSSFITAHGSPCSNSCGASSSSSSEPTPNNDVWKDPIPDSLDTEEQVEGSFLDSDSTLLFEGMHWTSNKSPLKGILKKSSMIAPLKGPWSPRRRMMLEEGMHFRVSAGDGRKHISEDNPHPPSEELLEVITGLIRRAKSGTAAFDSNKKPKIHLYEALSLVVRTQELGHFPATDLEGPDYVVDPRYIAALCNTDGSLRNSLTKLFSGKLTPGGSRKFANLITDAIFPLADTKTYQNPDFASRDDMAFLKNLHSSTCAGPKPEDSHDEEEDDEEKPDIATEKRVSIQVNGDEEEEDDVDTEHDDGVNGVKMKKQVIKKRGDGLVNQEELDRKLKELEKSQPKTVIRKSDTGEIVLSGRTSRMRKRKSVVSDLSFKHPLLAKISDMEAEIADAETEALKQIRTLQYKYKTEILEQFLALVVEEVVSHCTAKPKADGFPIHTPVDSMFQIANVSRTNKQLTKHVADLRELNHALVDRVRSAVANQAEKGAEDVLAKASTVIELFLHAFYHCLTRWARFEDIDERKHHAWRSPIEGAAWHLVSEEKSKKLFSDLHETMNGVVRRSGLFSKDGEQAEVANDDGTPKAAVHTSLKADAPSMQTVNQAVWFLFQKGIFTLHASGALLQAAEASLSEHQYVEKVQAELKRILTVTYLSIHGHIEQGLQALDKPVDSFFNEDPDSMFGSQAMGRTYNNRENIRKAELAKIKPRLEKIQGMESVIKILLVAAEKAGKLSEFEKAEIEKEFEVVKEVTRMSMFENYLRKSVPWEKNVESKDFFYESVAKMGEFRRAHAEGREPKDNAIEVADTSSPGHTMRASKRNTRTTRFKVPDSFLESLSELFHMWNSYAPKYENGSNQRDRNKKTLLVHVLEMLIERWRDCEICTSLIKKERTAEESWHSAMSTVTGKDATANEAMYGTWLCVLLNCHKEKKRSHAARGEEPHHKIRLHGPGVVAHRDGNARAQTHPGHGHEHGHGHAHGHGGNGHPHHHTPVEKFYDHLLHFCRELFESVENPGIRVELLEKLCLNILEVQQYRNLMDEASPHRHVRVSENFTILDTKETVPVEHLEKDATVPQLSSTSLSQVNASVGSVFSSTPALPKNVNQLLLDMNESRVERATLISALHFVSALNSMWATSDENALLRIGGISGVGKVISDIMSSDPGVPTSGRASRPRDSIRPSTAHAAADLHQDAHEELFGRMSGASVVGVQAAFAAAVAHLPLQPEDEDIPSEKVGGEKVGEPRSSRSPIPFRSASPYDSSPCGGRSMRMIMQRNQTLKMMGSTDHRQEKALQNINRMRKTFCANTITDKIRVFEDGSPADQASPSGKGMLSTPRKVGGFLSHLFEKANSLKTRNFLVTTPEYNRRKAAGQSTKHLEEVTDVEESATGSITVTRNGKAEKLKKHDDKEPLLLTGIGDSPLGARSGRPESPPASPKAKSPDAIRCTYSGRAFVSPSLKTDVTWATPKLSANSIQAHVREKAAILPTDFNLYLNGHRNHCEIIDHNTAEADRYHRIFADIVKCSIDYHESGEPHRESFKFGEHMSPMSKLRHNKELGPYYYYSLEDGKGYIDILAHTEVQKQWNGAVGGKDMESQTGSADGETGRPKSKGTVSQRLANFVSSAFTSKRDQVPSVFTTHDERAKFGAASPNSRLKMLAEKKYSPMKKHHKHHGHKSSGRVPAMVPLSPSAAGDALREVEAGKKMIMDPANNVLKIPLCKAPRKKLSTRGGGVVTAPIVPQESVRKNFLRTPEDVLGYCLDPNQAFVDEIHQKNKLRLGETTILGEEHKRGGGEALDKPAGTFGSNPTGRCSRAQKSKLYEGKNKHFYFGSARNPKPVSLHGGSHMRRSGREMATATNVKKDRLKTWRKCPKKAGPIPTLFLNIVTRAKMREVLEYAEQGLTQEQLDAKKKDGLQVNRDGLQKYAVQTAAAMEDAEKATDHPVSDGTLIHFRPSQKRVSRDTPRTWAKFFSSPLADSPATDLKEYSNNIGENGESKDHTRDTVQHAVGAEAGDGSYHGHKHRHKPGGLSKGRRSSLHGSHKKHSGSTEKSEGSPDTMKKKRRSVSAIRRKSTGDGLNQMLFYGDDGNMDDPSEGPTAAGNFHTTTQETTAGEAGHTLGGQSAASGSGAANLVPPIPLNTMNCPAGFRDSSRAPSKVSPANSSKRPSLDSGVSKNATANIDAAARPEASETDDPEFTPVNTLDGEKQNANVSISVINGVTKTVVDTYVERHSSSEVEVKRQGSRDSAAQASNRDAAVDRYSPGYRDSAEFGDDDIAQHAVVGKLENKNLPRDEAEIRDSEVVEGSVINTMNQNAGRRRDSSNLRDDDTDERVLPAPHDSSELQDHMLAEGAVVRAVDGSGNDATGKPLNEATSPGTAGRDSSESPGDPNAPKSVRRKSIKAKRKSMRGRSNSISNAVENAVIMQAQHEEGRPPSPLANVSNLRPPIDDGDTLSESSREPAKAKTGKEKRNSFGAFPKAVNAIEELGANKTAVNAQSLIKDMRKNKPMASLRRTSLGGKKKEKKEERGIISGDDAHRMFGSNSMVLEKNGFIEKVKEANKLHIVDEHNVSTCIGTNNSTMTTSDGTIHVPDHLYTGNGKKIQQHRAGGEKYMTKTELSLKGILNTTSDAGLSAGNPKGAKSTPRKAPTPRAARSPQHAKASALNPHSHPVTHGAAHHDCNNHNFHEDGQRQNLKKKHYPSLEIGGVPGVDYVLDPNDFSAKDEQDRLLNLLAKSGESQRFRYKEYFSANPLVRSAGIDIANLSKNVEFLNTEELRSQLLLIATNAGGTFLTNGQVQAILTASRPQLLQKLRTLIKKDTGNPRKPEPVFLSRLTEEGHFLYPKDLMLSKKMRNYKRVEH